MGWREEEDFEGNPTELKKQRKKFAEMKDAVEQIMEWKIMQRLYVR